MTVTGRYREDDGSRVVFHLSCEADTIEDAERVLGLISETGIIDGELIEEGEADLPFTIGHA
ncbi:MAG TPA: hypothetical protein VIO94_15895 [Phenylobacterium sp.]